jgi:hypothetical protein
MSVPHWRKSSRIDVSGNACVELARLEMTGSEWRKSSRSDVSGNDCVQVAKLPAAIGVRDSKNADSGHLTLDRATAEKFFQRVREGRYDL